jgi:hypothetical protein
VRCPADARPAYPHGMPLAPAHPAVVLPLQRLGLPLSALVVGAGAPDAPVYLPVGVSYQTAHSGWGITVDVVIGLAVLWLWFALLHDAVVDLTPPLRSRAPARTRLNPRAWLLAPLAVAVGAGTHVLWDSATHDWGFTVQELALPARSTARSRSTAGSSTCPPLSAPSSLRRTACSGCADNLCSLDPGGAPGSVLAGSGSLGRDGRRDRLLGPRGCRRRRVSRAARCRERVAGRPAAGAERAG